MPALDEYNVMHQEKDVSLENSDLGSTGADPFDALLLPKSAVHLENGEQRQ